jgi:hypothetical protein
MDMYCAALSRKLSLSACSDSLGPSHDARADVDPRGVSGSDRASASSPPTLQLRLRSGSRFMDSGMTRFFFPASAVVLLVGGGGGLLFPERVPASGLLLVVRRGPGLLGVRQAVDAHEARDEAVRPGRLGLGGRRGGLWSAHVGPRQGVEHRLDLHAYLIAQRD